MPQPIKLTKSDARRALVRHHFTQCADQRELYDRLRSIQFDPIAPIGCNHDLVAQARVPGYRIGDWEKLAYQERFIYDGWDKMASLVPFSGWPLRRYISEVGRRSFGDRIFLEHKQAVDCILKELTDRGPIKPKDFDFQEHREEWKGTWFGPSVTKQTLRALWHSGMIMTSGRDKGQHIYDLTERIVPQALRDEPVLSEDAAIQELILERHRAMGFLRPNASPEIFSNQVLNPSKRPAIAALVDRRDLVPVDIEGMKTHAMPEFISRLDAPDLEPRVIFIAPLDPFMWDRKMSQHVFDFEYTWEIYTPLAKRRWGYYVLPILFGNDLVARAEFHCRKGEIEVREWHTEGDLNPKFWDAFAPAIKNLMHYAGASSITVLDHVAKPVRSAITRAAK